MNLKELLGDELYGKLEKVDFFQDVKTAFEAKKLVIDDGKTFVTRERLNEVIGQRDTAKAQLEERDKTIETMQTDLAKLKDVDPKKMKDEIQALTDKNTQIETEYKDKLQKLQRSTKLRELLMGEKIQGKQVYVEDIERRLDAAKLAWSDDNTSVSGLDEQIPELKKNFPDLFGEVKRNGPPFNPGDPKPPAGELYTKEEFLALSQEDRVKNIDKVNKSVVHWQTQGN